MKFLEAQNRNIRRMSPLLLLRYNNQLKPDHNIARENVSVSVGVLLMKDLTESPTDGTDMRDKAGFFETRHISV